MGAIGDLYNQIVGMDDKAVDAWVRESRKRIIDYSRTAFSGSPFLDRPSVKSDLNKGRFWIRADFKHDSITMYGIAPNAGRLKTFGAPVGKYHATKPYRFKYGKRWVTFHRAQDVSASVGLDIKQPYYGGSPVHVTKYFGIKASGRGAWAYGRTNDGEPVRVYAEDSYMDWLIKNHRAAIDEIIIEAGRDVLATLANGGAK